ncbi:MAG: nicotinate phosphoribosyltransferase [Defluviitaleaceae bacterium]|nr:nicotinate phosphoribosyltransferase [Defluviitaleaceae bacterium]
MDTMNNTGNNLTLLTDFYQLTMMQAYHKAQQVSQTPQYAVFDMFYRENPNQSAYAIIAGLEQVVEYIQNLHFTADDISYLQDMNVFSADFIEYLKGFRFTGDIYAIPEGTVVFPNEPLIKVKAPIQEAQLVETAILNIVNHQSLIATKAARIVWAAAGDTVLEFGLRRAQGPDAGLYGARAAIIGGCHGTSNVLAGKRFNVPVGGTHAHSWIMSHDTELNAFRSYAKMYPHNCILLVDTYDTLRNGVPNAITVFSEMRAAGVESKRFGIRLDSGDMAYLSKEARRQLDAAGFTNAIISASGDLDEYLVTDLKAQGAKISLWGVGTNLITSKDYPAFGGVYKLAAETGTTGEWLPRIKLSENPIKVTNPAEKKVFRLYDVETGKAKADLVTLVSEKIAATSDLTIFDPIAPWKRMTLRANEFTARELLQPVFLSGKCVYSPTSVMEIRKNSIAEQATLWDEYKRLTKPHLFPVDLSQSLYDLKQKMIHEIRA